jgi:hypothetical protein
MDIVDLRLRNQRLSRTAFRKPEEVVTWLGAVQAQDYAGAKWGLGQRALGLSEAAIDRAFDEGHILRTHILRPTWHFIPNADARWMLSLSAPRVHAVSGYAYRTLELDGTTLIRAHAVFERALRGGRSLTRRDLAAALKRGGIAADGQRLAYIVMHAELEQVVTSGPRSGKQFTYMLVDDRVRKAVRLSADAALAELTRRYLVSHGPATIRDYVWWSGLTVRQARTGLEMLASTVAEEKVGDFTYWSISSRATGTSTPSSVYLLSNYDEYLIAYKDRGYGQQLVTSATANREIDIYAHILLVDGRFGGTWRRTADRNACRVSVQPSRALNRAHVRDLSAASARLGAFMGLGVTLSPLS